MDEPSHWQILVWTVSASFAEILLISGIFTAIIWRMFGRSVDEVDEKKQAFEVAVQRIKDDLSNSLRIVKEDLSRQLVGYHNELQTITSDHVHRNDFGELRAAVDVIRNKQGENTGVISAMITQIANIERRFDIHVRLGQPDSGHND